MPATPPPVVSLDVKEWQTILDALTERPFKDVANIINKVTSQVNRQIAPPVPPEAENKS